MFIRLLLCLMITLPSDAQQGASLVVKVRAPAAKCRISTKQSYLLLEINNPVRIQVEGRNKEVQVVLSEGKIKSVEGDTYYMQFPRAGMVLISVYQQTSSGKKLIATKKMEVREPTVYLCGIKTDSTARGIKLTGTNFYAWSDHYKKEMPIVSFEMYFIKDTSIKKGPDMTKPVAIKSDTPMLTAEMKKIILSFQPKFSYIFFHKIVCQVPDGSKRLLDPVELNVLVDTTNKEKMSLIYSVTRKKL
jgi:hypothetical protein